MANRKISDLTALTTPASGDYLPIVDISEVADANKNKRITIEELMRGAPDGTAAAPGIAFEGSGNGLYSPGADQVAISTNGTGRLFVDSSGNVGAGSASLSSLFRVTVNGNGSSIVGGLSLRNNGTEYLTIGNANVSSATDVDIWHTQNGYLRFATNDQERLRITSDGKVGLGTSSPDANSQLHIVGSSYQPLYVNTTSVGGGGATFFRSGTQALYVGTGGSTWLTGSSTADGLIRAEANLVLATNGNTRAITIDSSQRVGVGTTSPAGTGVDIGGAGASAASFVANPKLGIAGDIFFDPGSGNDVEIFNYRTTGMAFGVGGVEKARIDSSGRLLVGTTSTTATNAKLVAVSSDKEFAPIRAGGTGGNGFSVIADTYSGDESNLVIGVSYSSAAPLFCYSCKPSTTADNTYLSSQAQYATKPGVIRLNNDGLRYLATNTSANTAVGTSVTLTNRMLINSSGIAWFTSNNTFGGDAGVDYHSFNVDSSSQWAFGIFNDATSGGYGLVVNYPNSDPNNTTSEAYYFIANGVPRFAVRSNGGIANYQANDVNLCDEREKKNIENLQSTWDCLKHWELKKFHYNEDSDTEAKRYGVIAQQIEEHCPEVISEWVKQKAEDAKLDDEGNVIEPAKEEITRMAVKEQQMYWMAIKALQEAQVRIEQLEAKVAALESA